METIRFETVHGPAFVQPQHIIGCFPREGGGCYIATMASEKFFFKEDSKTVWDMILTSYQTIQQEKAIQMAQYIQAVQAKPPKEGDFN